MSPYQRPPGEQVRAQVLTVMVDTLATGATGRWGYQGLSSDTGVPTYENADPWNRQAGRRQREQKGNERDGAVGQVEKQDEELSPRWEGHRRPESAGLAWDPPGLATLASCCALLDVGV